MQLKPRLPPGRSSRKALRFGHDVRRLRDEGHTLESIRQALLDVGVSVSLSTVRREAVRPASKWELEHMEEVSRALAELPPPPTVPDRTPWLQQSGAGSGQSVGATGTGSGFASTETFDDRRSFGLLSRVIAALRRLRRAHQVS